LNGKKSGKRGRRDRERSFRKRRTKENGDDCERRDYRVKMLWGGKNFESARGKDTLKATFLREKLLKGAKRTRET